MSSIGVHLPELFRLQECEDGLVDGRWPMGEGLVCEVHAKRPIQYVGPTALTMISAWAFGLKARGGRILIDDSVKTPATWRSGLLSALACRHGERRLVGQVRMRLQAHGEIREALGRLTALLRLKNTDASEAMQYWFSELLRNVFEHASSDAGAFVSASYFPATDRLTLAVADLGITIPKHVARNWPTQTPSDRALAAALEPRLSGSDDMNRNAGVGLYMTRRLVTHLGGQFWVSSGGVAASAKEASRTAPEVFPAAHWPGTCVALTVYPKRIDDFTLELSMARNELQGGERGQQIRLELSEVPDGAVVIDLQPVVGWFAEDKATAEALRKDLIMPTLHAGGQVVFDFKGVGLTTQSFIHALLAEPLKALGPRGVEGRLSTVRTATQITQVLRLVVGYVLDDLLCADDLP